MVRLFFSLLAEHASAQTPCPLGSDLPCWGGGLTGFANILYALVPIGTDIFYALLALMLVVYAIALIVGSSDENSITEARKAFTFAVIGSIVVWANSQGFLWAAIRPGGGALINLASLNPVMASALGYIRILGATAATGFVIIRALRLISAGGDEGAISSQRKLFLNAIIGVGILVLATTLVDAALGNTSVLSQEAKGIASYVIYILGVFLGLGVIVGGAMLVLSYDEGLKDRAKKSIFGSLIVIAVLVCLGAIINLVA